MIKPHRCAVQCILSNLWLIRLPFTVMIAWYTSMDNTVPESLGPCVNRQSDGLFADWGLLGRLQWWMSSAEQSHIWLKLWKCLMFALRNAWYAVSCKSEVFTSACAALLKSSRICIYHLCCTALLWSSTLMTLCHVLSQLDRYDLTGLHILIISLWRHPISSFIHYLYNKHTLCFTNKLAHMA